MYDRPDYLFEDEDDREFYETLDWSDVVPSERAENSAQSAS
jgi:hypothetical protein